MSMESGRNGEVRQLHVSLGGWLALCGHDNAQRTVAKETLHDIEVLSLLPSQG